MIRWRYAATAASLLALGLSACATTGTNAPAKSTQASAKPAEKAEIKPLPKGLDGQASSGFPSTYKPLPSRPTAFVGATVLTATGQQIENGVVIASGGKIVAVGGPDTPIPA
ncbi:MAG: amidohydrolase, partial [Caulobacter sp.]|nr:amidohydrolase [Caulobacter sp.]